MPLKVKSSLGKVQRLRQEALNAQNLRSKLPSPDRVVVTTLDSFTSSRLRADGVSIMLGSPSARPSEKAQSTASCQLTPSSSAETAKPKPRPLRQQPVLPTLPNDAVSRRLQDLPYSNGKITVRTDSRRPYRYPGDVIAGTVVGAMLTIKKKIRRKFMMTSHRWSDVLEFRNLLGITSDIKRVKPIRDCIFIAIDTESETHALKERVVEIGITVLDTRKLRDVGPGAYLRNWIGCMQHRHIVINWPMSSTKKRGKQGTKNLFGTSELMSPEQAKQGTRDFLRNAAAASITDNGFLSSDNARANNHPQVILVGHSLEMDVYALSRPNFAFNLLDPADAGMKFDSIFCTYSEAARNYMRFFEDKSKRLGSIVRFLGLAPEYHASDAPGKQKLVEKMDGVKGVHNAQNDAAYTMMALLMFVLRRVELVGGTLKDLKSSDALWEAGLDRRGAGGYVRSGQRHRKSEADLQEREATDNTRLEQRQRRSEADVQKREVEEYCPARQSWWAAGLRSISQLFSRN